MSLIQYISDLIRNMEPYSPAASPQFKAPYRLCESGALSDEAPADCLHRFRLLLRRIKQGDCGLTGATRQLSALLLVESACPAAMPGLWLERCFEEESLRLLKLLCGDDHSQAGLLAVLHIESTRSAEADGMVLFRHEFELHYLNHDGE